MPLTAASALALELGLVRRVGERQPAGEHAPVPARKLTRVERSRGDVLLGDADLDAAADEPWVDRVVVAIDPHIRLRRNAEHLAAIRVRHPDHRSHPLALLHQSLRWDGADRAVHAPVGAIAPAVELQLKVGRVREPTPGLEVRAQEPMRALEHALRLRRQLRLIGRLRSELSV